jgi:hypothetical protein
VGCRQPGAGQAKTSVNKRISSSSLLLLLNNLNFLTTKVVKRTDSTTASFGIISCLSRVSHHLILPWCIHHVGGLAFASRRAFLWVVADLRHLQGSLPHSHTSSATHLSRHRRSLQLPQVCPNTILTSLARNAKSSMLYFPHTTRRKDS